MCYSLLQVWSKFLKKKDFFMKIPAFFAAVVFFSFPSFAQEVFENTALEERIFVENSYVPNYRELMRDITVAFSEFARRTNPDFKILAFEGRDLLTQGQWENDLEELHKAELAGAKTEDERFLLKLFSPEESIPVGMPNRRYLQALDGIVFENLVCGGKTPSEETKKVLEDNGITVFAVEHCRAEKSMRAGLAELEKKKIAAHADTDSSKKFDTVKSAEKLFMENQKNVLSLQDVRNLRVMKNSTDFASKGDWVDALAATNYDMIAVDPFFRFNRPLTKEDVQRLKHKKLGAKRLVFAVLNISLAEDTRPYWELTWKPKSPYWLRFPIADNPSAVMVDYWNTEWKRIIGVYFKEIVALGYDGVLLEGLDAHKTFERIIPIN